MFYSDLYNELPTGIINKKICGCGITSFALENSQPLILCVPTIEMIENKIAQYPNSRRSEPVLGLYGSVSPNSILEQLSLQSIPKVIVTYDSFHKVKHLPYRVVIDEFSELLDAYTYRREAISRLIEDLKGKEVTYISATPILEKYLPDSLKNIPHTELEWKDSNLLKVKVKSLHTTRPRNSVLNLISKYKNNLVELNGHKSTQAFFFINSVQLIKYLIDKASLLPSDVHIVCSKSSYNKNLLESFEISTTTEINNNPKTFNFITSTGFKGCDFYSESGISYVVSCSSKLTTLLTIDTDIYQIAGRIRTKTNPFRNFIYHIYNSNPLSLNEEEFKDYVDNKIRITKSNISLFSKGTEQEKQDLLYTLNKNGTLGTYLKLEQDYLLFDTLLYLQEQRIYQTVIKVYQSGLCVNNFYDELEEQFELEKESDLDFFVNKDFSNLLKKYLKSPNPNIIKEYPLIAEAYQLGEKKCKALGYNSTKIRDYLDFLKHKEIISSLIKEKLKHDFISLKDTKVMLSKIYKDLGLKQTAKASDLPDYIQVKKTRNKSLNTWGYLIL